MSIQLYRKGLTHTVRGITCEAKNFNASELPTQLKEGWHTNPNDMKIDVTDAIKESNRKGVDIKSNDEITKPKKKGKKGSK